MVSKSPNFGGARKGAGRKKGSVVSPSKRLAMKIREGLQLDGKISPLEVLVGAMRFHWELMEKAGQSKKPEDFAVMLSSMKEAASYANMAAPYIHPKLQSTILKGPNDGPIAVQIIDDLPRPASKPKAGKTGG